MKKLIYLIIIISFACNQSKDQTQTAPYAMVLGVAQDAGYPQISCKKKCCEDAWKNPELQKTTSCLAIIDPISKQQWIIDATPNIKEQLYLLKQNTGNEKLDGILLTHAHIGHYTGLMHFGKEVMGTNNLSVYTCLLYTSPSPRDVEESRMPSSA